MRPMIQANMRAPFDAAVLTNLIAQVGELTEEYRQSNEKLGNLYDGGEDEFPLAR